MAVGHGTAGRGSEARQAAMTSGPDDCHVTMQAAMAVVLAKRWPYVAGVEMAVASLVRSARTMTRAWPAGSGMKTSGRGKCS